MKPSIGRIVVYTLSDADAASINTLGRVNTARAGDELPAIAVRVWSDEMVNLQVFVDGQGTHWATSRSHGETGQHGTWHWPERVG